VYVIYVRRALLLFPDMFILSPMTYPLMGCVYTQATWTSSKLLSCVNDFPIDFKVVNKNYILTYLKLQKKKSYRFCSKGVCLMK
jgi:hypothetical protein